MICPTCHSETAVLRITSVGQSCPKCGGFSSTSGSRVDGALQRNSFRVREQQQHYEGDMLPPHQYNRQTRRKEPNPEFIKQFPETIHNHFTPEELRKAKMPKLAERVHQKQTTPKRADPNVSFKGNAKAAIKKLVKS